MRQVWILKREQLWFVAFDWYYRDVAAAAAHLIAFSYHWITKSITSIYCTNHSLISKQRGHLAHWRKVPPFQGSWFRSLWFLYYSFIPSGYIAICMIRIHLKIYFHKQRKSQRDDISIEIYKQEEYKRRRCDISILISQPVLASDPRFLKRGCTQI